MATIASSAFLTRLRSLYPKTNTVGTNPSGLVAAIAYSASNRPEAVPLVFIDALRELRTTQAQEDERVGHEARLRLARRFRDALLQSGLLSGYPRAINSLAALHETMPPELRDATILRDTKTSMSDWEANGARLYQSMYGGQADEVQRLLDTAYPDMGWFSRVVGYGITYGGANILSPLETTYTIIAALIPGDTPRQIAWHMNNARTQGASLEEVNAVRSIAIEVAKECGVTWREGVPQL